MCGDDVSSGPIVLLHGAWHGSWGWATLTPHLVAAGRRVLAVDMAGHGLDARLPASATARPFDRGAFATEPSPVADVTLDTAAERLVGQLRDLRVPVVLVGHSMGGTVITAAAARAPELVEALVYVCAFMPASGVPAGAYIKSPENEGERVAELAVADPAALGALRLDVGSPDPDYRAGIKAAFYTDVSDDVFDATVRLLSTDFPMAIAAGATELTPDGWGAIPRTYVVCTGDEAIMEPLQRRFIDEADAAFPGNPTRVVELATAHSPFLTLPAELAAAILAA
jgi:pimeloyl-ACP methyl ester carboxylesterase